MTDAMQTWLDIVRDVCRMSSFLLLLRNSQYLQIGFSEHGDLLYGPRPVQAFFPVARCLCQLLFRDQRSGCISRLYFCLITATGFFCFPLSESTSKNGFFLRICLYYWSAYSKSGGGIVRKRNAIPQAIR